MDTRAQSFKRQVVDPGLLTMTTTAKWRLWNLPRLVDYAMFFKILRGRKKSNLMQNKCKEI